MSWFKSPPTAATKTPNQNGIEGTLRVHGTYNPYEPPYNMPSFHFIFHCLFHVILHSWSKLQESASTAEVNMFVVSDLLTTATILILDQNSS